jgi:hypothetical protein
VSSPDSCSGSLAKTPLVSSTSTTIPTCKLRGGPCRRLWSRVEGVLEGVIRHDCRSVAGLARFDWFSPLRTFVNPQNSAPPEDVSP